MGTNYQKRSQTFAGNVTVGKTLTASSQSTLTKAATLSSAVTFTKTATFSSRAILPKQAASTQGTTLVNFGISSVVRKSSAGTSTQLYTLAAPASGVWKFISCIDAGSTRTVRVTLASGSFYSSGNSTTLTRLTFNAANEGATLLGISTSKYFIISTIGSPAIA